MQASTRRDVHLLARQPDGPGAARRPVAVQRAAHGRGTLGTADDPVDGDAHGACRAPRPRRSRTIEGWTDFAVIAGGASAALLGLLFVAVSIRAEAIAAAAELRSRVAQILTVFLALLTACIAVGIPNPAGWILGVELLVVASVAGTVLAVLDHRAKAEAAGRRVAMILDRINPNVITSVLIGLAGLALLFGFGAGLFLLAGAVVVGFVGGVAGAWIVLITPPEPAAAS
jgi:hypothetical protein